MLIGGLDAVLFFWGFSGFGLRVRLQGLKAVITGLGVGFLGLSGFWGQGWRFRAWAHTSCFCYGQSVV